LEEACSWNVHHFWKEKAMKQPVVKLVAATLLMIATQLLPAPPAEASTCCDTCRSRLSSCTASCNNSYDSCARACPGCPF
jgi:hypothetical protein